MPEKIVYDSIPLLFLSLCVCLSPLSLSHALSSASQWFSKDIDLSFCSLLLWMRKQDPFQNIWWGWFMQHRGIWAAWRWWEICTTLVGFILHLWSRGQEQEPRTYCLPSPDVFKFPWLHTHIYFGSFYQQYKMIWLSNRYQLYYDLIKGLWGRDIIFNICGGSIFYACWEELIFCKEVYFLLQPCRSMRS